MKIQESLLATGEPSHIDDLCGADSHSFQGVEVGNRRDYEPATVLEANEPAIKEMINAWRQEQPVLSI